MPQLNSINIATLHRETLLAANRHYYVIYMAPYTIESYYFIPHPAVGGHTDIIGT